MMYELKVDRERCNGCGICVVSCPVNALEKVEVQGGKGVDTYLLVGDSKAQVKEQGFCTGCGVCVSMCPFGAIFLASFVQKPFSRTLKIDEMPMVGMEALVYETIKGGGALTLPEVSGTLDVSVREVIPHVSKLKLDEQIHQEGHKGEDHLYTAGLKKKEEDSGKKKGVALPKLDPEKVRKLKEPLDAMIESMHKLKVRVLIEKGEAQKAKEAIEKERGG